MAQGRLVVFEGLDKSGKTTLIKELMKEGGYVYRKALSREGWLGRIAHRYPCTSLFTLQLLANSCSLRRTLKDGSVVLQDRYYPSIVTFSGSLYDQVLGVVAAFALPIPDLYVHMTVSGQERLKRLKTDLSNPYHRMLYENPGLIAERENRFMSFYEGFRGNKMILDTTDFTLEETVSRLRAGMDGLGS